MLFDWPIKQYASEKNRTEIGRLGAILHSRFATARLIAVLDLRAYFDESGTDGNSRVVVWAGYIAPQEDWCALEDAWQTVLDKEGAEYYHATDAENARKPRGIYDGWPRKKARNLTNQLAHIAASSVNLKGVGIYITLDAWNAASAFVREHFPDDSYALPYTILVRSCIETVMECLNDDLPKEEQVAFIFENNCFSVAALEGYQILKETHPKSARFGAISFEGKRGFPALQAADLFAWQYRRVTELRKGYRGHKIHRSLRGLIKPDFRFHFLSKNYVHEMLVKAVHLLLDEQGF